MYEGTVFLTSCCHCCYYYFEKIYINSATYTHIHTLVCIWERREFFYPFIWIYSNPISWTIQWIYFNVLRICLLWNIFYFSMDFERLCVYVNEICVDVNEWICCMRMYILGRVNNSFNAILWIYVFYSLVVQIFWVTWFELKLDFECLKRNFW